MRLGMNWRGRRRRRAGAACSLGDDHSIEGPVQSREPSPPACGARTPVWLAATLTIFNGTEANGHVLHRRPGRVRAARAPTSRSRGLMLATPPCPRRPPPASTPQVFEQFMIVVVAAQLEGVVDDSALGRVLVARIFDPTLAAASERCGARYLS